MWKHVLKNSMVPIITRVMFSIPLVVVSGSLLIESYFGIPGIGKVTYDAIVTGENIYNKLGEVKDSTAAAIMP